MTVDTRQREEQLVQENLGLVVTLAKFFRPPNSTEMDEYIQIGTIALWKAIRDHDPKRGALSTLAWHYIKWDIIRYIKQQKKHWHQSLGYPCIEASIPDPEHFWEFLPDTLTQDERRATELRTQGSKFKDIGKELGYSRAWIHILLKNAMRKINEAN